MRLRAPALILCCFGLAGCGLLYPAAGPSPASAARRSRAAFHREADSLVALPEFRNAEWGILVVDPLDGDTIYSHLASKLFLPASNMKLATSSTALAQLGPDFRFRTTVLARGSIADGQLVGDLIVSGRGDPTVSDHMRGDAMAPLRDMADSLLAHGVHRITGRVLGGDDVFPGATRGYGWPWDQLDDSDFAGVDELLFNEGFTHLAISGGARSGDPVRVTTAPARTFPGVRVDALTIALPPMQVGGQTVPPPVADIEAHYDTLQGGLVVTGWIGAGDTTSLDIAQHDPDTAYLAALVEALHDRGVEVAGNATLPAPRADTLFTMLSPPLRDILPALLKPSQNQIAEVLLRTIGLERAGAGTPDSGRAVVARQLASFGAAPDGYVIHDGSGLSRYDYLSPETIVRILDAVRRSPNFQLFYDALPIAGVDGTLRSRMAGTPAQGNVHGKTGTLTGARSLSGYVRTADGRLLEFSMLCNNWTVPVSDVNLVQDSLAVSLARMRLR